MKRPTLLVDSDLRIPAALQACCDDIIAVPGREISSTHLSGIDALWVRSVTPINRELLTDSAVRFVGTATAGTDHLDTAWLASAGICYASAPGCNANAVVEYVLSVLTVTGRLEAVMAGAEVGIVGLGQVGSRLARAMLALGASVKAYDPFVTNCPDGVLRADLPDVLGSPIVTLHAALHSDSQFPSLGMIDEAAADLLPAGGLLINAGRGGLVTVDALASLISNDVDLVLDTWPDEPAVAGALLEDVLLASPHIAGYSEQTRDRGPGLLLSPFCDYFDLPAPEPWKVEGDFSAAMGMEELSVTSLTEALLNAFDPRVVDKQVRAQACPDVAASAFDQLRRNFGPRNELAAQLSVDDLIEQSIDKVLGRLASHVRS